MNVLMVLAEKPGELVTRDELMRRVWSNRDVTDEALTRAISILRKIFSEDNVGYKYIQTIPKKGYSLYPELKFERHDTLNIEQTTPASVQPKSPIRADVKILYQQGCALLERPFADGVLENAIAYLQQAVVLDETYAEAHAALGEAYFQLATYSQDGDKLSIFLKSLTSTEHAVKLNPLLGASYALIAMHRYILGDMEGALDLAFKAFEMASDNPETALRLGYFLATIGRTKQAIPYYEHALSLDPTRGRYLQCLALAKLCNDNLDEAESLAKQAIDFQHLFAHETYAAVAYAKGKHSVAAERFTNGCYKMYKRFGEDFIDPDKWKKYSNLVYSRDPDIRRSVAKWIRQTCERPGEPPSVPLMAGLIRTGSAEAIFEVCTGNGPPVGAHGSFLRIWGSVDTCKMIYHHKDFMAFAKRIGMKAAWNKYGLPDRLTTDELF